MLDIADIEEGNTSISEFMDNLIVLTEFMDDQSRQEMSELCEDLGLQSTNVL